MKLTKTVAVLALSVAAAHYAVAGGASLMYVQRGLVAQYDGINNAGTGSHDPSATTWKNLAGDESLDGTCDTKLSWNGENGWTVSGDCKPVVLGAKIAQTMSTTNFTIQIACTPAMIDKRMCYFGQYNGSTSYGSANIEHEKGTGKLRLFRTKESASDSTGNFDWKATATMTRGQFASFAYTVEPAKCIVYKTGASSQTYTTRTFGASLAATESVIGGEVQRTGRTSTDYTSGYGITFQGTYYAFRVYNVALTATEVAWNAGLDAVRFNGADAATTLGPEYSYDAATDTLTTDTTYYAPKTGTDAADGLRFDISFTGDTTADGVVFSQTDSPVSQSYETADVPLPVLPTVTNKAVSCVYLPQPSDTSTEMVFRQDARVKNVAVTGQVATVFCRFRWDGSVLPGEVNYPSVIMNGYESWNAYPNEGFCLRMRAEKNATRGYFSFVFPNNAVAYNNAGITTTGIGYINQDRWVDVFASVYPSPTNPTLSNADVWYCEVPSWNKDGYFNSSELNHRHFGDACGISRMNTTTRKTVIFGSEPNAAVEAVTKGNGVKCLRGAFACAKGWDRLLSENEMWTVMAGLGGVQSFTDLSTVAGRTYKTIDSIDTDAYREGRNGTPVSFLGGDDPAAHRWRALTQTHKANTLIFDAPKGAKTYPYVYKTKINNAATGKTQPIHLEFNGKTVWSSANAAKGDEITVELSEEDALPGINELKWVYDTTETSNWIIFRYHQLKVSIHSGLILILR